LLTMMAILNRHQELPRDRPELYNQASRVLLHQWDVETKLLEDSQLKDLRISIDYKDKQGMLRKVAHHMQSSAKGLAGNIISATDLENILTDYLRGIVEKGEPRMVARQMIHQLRTRNFILCYLVADSYAFVHRTFLEYFCAWEFVWQFKETQMLTVERLKNEVFAPHWQDESWHEVLRLISGMIDAKFVAEMIDYLLDRKVDKLAFLDNQRKQKKEGLSNLLLAANCFVEIRNKKTIDSKSISDRLIKALQCELEMEKAPHRGSGRDLNRETAYALTNLVAAVGQNNLQILEWLKDCLNFGSSLSYVRIGAVNSIAHTWKDNPDTLTWLKYHAENNPGNIGNVSVHAIARGWKNDSHTLIWLKHHAEKFGTTSGSAVYAIAHGWKDNPAILPWLKYHVQNDNSWNIRHDVINAIVYSSKHDSDTLPMLKHCAQHDDYWPVRHAAVSALAYGWKDDPETLPIVKYRAQYDEHGDVRHAAVFALSREWNDENQVFKFLCNLVCSSPLDKFRRIPIRAITQNYPDRSEVLDLLLDRSKNDPDEQVRKFAEEQLTIWRSRSTS
jgi:HEAT repeats